MHRYPSFRSVGELGNEVDMLAEEDFLEEQAFIDEGKHVSWDCLDVCVCPKPHLTWRPISEYRSTMGRVLTAGDYMVNSDSYQYEILARYSDTRDNTGAWEYPGWTNGEYADLPDPEYFCEIEKPRRD